MKAESKPDPRFLASQFRKPSGKFAHAIGEKMNAINHRQYELLFDLMQLNNSDNILEIGFGNGNFFGKLISLAANLSICGLDMSDEMVLEALAKNSSHISGGNLKLLHGNSDKMPYPDDYFEKIFCINVIYFWDNPSDHLYEIYRVLKPGGYFYSVLRSKESAQQQPFTQYGFELYDLEEWKQILIKNGFEVTDVIIDNGSAETDTGLSDRPLKTDSLFFIGKKTKNVRST